MWIEYYIFPMDLTLLAIRSYGSLKISLLFNFNVILVFGTSGFTFPS